MAVWGTLFDRLGPMGESGPGVKPEGLINICGC